MSNSQTAAYGATVLRVSLGTLLLAHAGLKILVFTAAGTAAYFESLGLPGAFAYATILAETAGGLALVAGVYTRLASLALVPLIAGTILFVHGANGWAFANEGGGWEVPAFLIAALITQALIGPGAFALKILPTPLRPALA